MFCLIHNACARSLVSFNSPSSLTNYVSLASIFYCDYQFSSAFHLPFTAIFLFLLLDLYETLFVVLSSSRFSVPSSVSKPPLPRPLPCLFFVSPSCPRIKAGKSRKNGGVQVVGKGFRRKPKPPVVTPIFREMDVEMHQSLILSGHSSSWISLPIHRLREHGRRQAGSWCLT